jgi:hypothetical protein
LTLGVCESAITYDAIVGVNWGLLVFGAAVGMLICSWRTAALSVEQRWLPATLSGLLAAALAVTADPLWQFWIAVCSVSTLSVQALGLLGRRLGTIGAGILVFAPFKSAAGVLQECIRRVEELLEQLQAEATVPLIRAVALALPVAVVLAWLLSGADPLLAAWRDALITTLLQISIIPRLLWFITMSVLTLGGLGLALRPLPATADAALTYRQGLLFSRTDQVTVLGSAAAVFATYLALQLSRLFGNVAAAVGSHVTYAETVHQGFFELNAAVTLSALVTFFLLSRSLTTPVPRASKALAGILAFESQLLAISALHRVRLYEAAYGYTEQRLLVEVYAGAAIVVLGLLGWEVVRIPDFRRLARRTWALGLVTLCGLILWNHQAWIVRANVARYERTGLLDTYYLVGLAPDGLPEIARALPRLNPTLRGQLEICLRGMAGPSEQQGPDHWFEWTLRGAESRKVLRHFPPPADPLRQWSKSGF